MRDPFSSFDDNTRHLMENLKGDTSVFEYEENEQKETILRQEIAEEKERRSRYTALLGLGLMMALFGSFGANPLVSGFGILLGLALGVVALSKIYLSMKRISILKRALSKE